MNDDEPIEEGYTNIEELMKEQGAHPHPEVKKVEDDFKDKYFRQLAEMENMRKRLQEEKQHSIGFAVDQVIADFLTPMDQLEKALQFAGKASDEVQNWARGFQMILLQFQHVLAENDIKAFDSVGKPLDSYRHEAIETIETSDYSEGTVVEEIIKGYEKNGRVIRPARVKVAAKCTIKEGVNHDEKEK